MIHHKMYIPHTPAFVNLVCFLQPMQTAVGLLSWHYFPSSSLLCIIFFSVYTYLNFNRMVSSTFQIFLQIFNKKYYNLTIFTAILLTPAIFFEDMEPMFVIHNISIATDDDIMQFGDDVNIYPVYLSRAIIIWGNCLNKLEKTVVSDHIFCQFLVS